MQIPAATFIEAAADQLRARAQGVLADESKELRCAIGAPMAKTLTMQFPLNQDAIAGYWLGIETARVIIRTSAAIAVANVNPDTVL